MSAFEDHAGAERAGPRRRRELGGIAPAELVVLRAGSALRHGWAAGEDLRLLVTHPDPVGRALAGGLADGANRSDVHAELGPSSPPHPLLLALSLLERGGRQAPEARQLLVAIGPPHEQQAVRSLDHERDRLLERLHGGPSMRPAEAWPRGRRRGAGRGGASSEPGIHLDPRDSNAAL